jgi:hypothetical protein
MRRVDGVEAMPRRLDAVEATTFTLRVIRVPLSRRRGPLIGPRATHASH